MLKIVCVLFLSCQAFASDPESESAHAPTLQSFPIVPDFSILASSEDERKAVSRKNRKKKHSVGGRITKKQCRPNWQEFYLDVDQQLVEAAIMSLDETEAKECSSPSYFIHSDEAREQTFNTLSSDKHLKPFVPLLKNIIDVIVEVESVKSRSVTHLALRFDPDTSKMFKAPNRKFTHGWHAHGMDDRYVFTLTKDNELTTQIRYDGQKKNTDANRLFLLPGPMEHRTPKQKPGRRLQLSVGLAGIGG